MVASEIEQPAFCAEVSVIVKVLTAGKMLAVAELGRRGRISLASGMDSSLTLICGVVT